MDTNSTSIPSYCTVDRRIARSRYKPRPPQQPHHFGGGGGSVQHQTNTNSSDDSLNFNGLHESEQQRRPRIYRVNKAHSSVDLLLDDETYNTGSNTLPRGLFDPIERPEGMMIQYDTDPHDGVTRFNEADMSSSRSSNVDLDLNMLPLDATHLPAQAIIKQRPRPRGPPHRARFRGQYDTLRSNPSVKSVTIAPGVTEFHYPEG